MGVDDRDDQTPSKPCVMLGCQGTMYLHAAQDLPNAKWPWFASWRCAYDVTHFQLISNAGYHEVRWDVLKERRASTSPVTSWGRRMNAASWHDTEGTSTYRGQDRHPESPRVDRICLSFWQHTGNAAPSADRLSKSLSTCNQCSTASLTATLAHALDPLANALG